MTVCSLHAVAHRDHHLALDVVVGRRSAPRISAGMSGVSGGVCACAIPHHEQTNEATTARAHLRRSAKSMSESLLENSTTRRPEAGRCRVEILSEVCEVSNTIRQIRTPRWPRLNLNRWRGQRLVSSEGVSKRDLKLPPKPLSERFAASRFGGSVARNLPADASAAICF